MTIQLIVGLGNPGPEYEKTRHNAGAWFVEAIADRQGVSLKKESKFFGQIARVSISSRDCFLLFPSTYMNLSGQSVLAVMQFYKIKPEDILVAHDELDFEPGILRLKSGGGHGGHNGLRDLVSKLGSPAFYRLRIGIGHPGHKDRVTPYVLGAPSAQERAVIDEAIEEGIRCLPLMLEGRMEEAVKTVNSL